jgi:hypothetical protein
MPFTDVLATTISPLGVGPAFPGPPAYRVLAFLDRRAGQAAMSPQSPEIVR